MENITKKTGLTAAAFATSGLSHMQHGCTSKSLFIKDEQPSDYLALLDSAFEQFKPFSDHDAGIVSRCVHDHWILLRRERAADNAEAELYLRHPEESAWTEKDFDDMTRFHRYKTEASRAYERSLYALKAIKKIQREEERWQAHLDVQKKKLALQIERFEFFKQRAAENAVAKAAATTAPAEEPPPPDFATPPEPPPTQNSVNQTLYVGEEKGQAVIYETTPTNAALRESLTPNTNINRTYNFVGSVPADCQHLITDDAYKFGKSTSINKTYSYEDWSNLAESES